MGDYSISYHQELNDVDYYFQHRMMAVLGDQYFAKHVKQSEIEKARELGLFRAKVSFYEDYFRASLLRDTVTNICQRLYLNHFREIAWTNFDEDVNDTPEEIKALYKAIETDLSAGKAYKENLEERYEIIQELRKAIESDIFAQRAAEKNLCQLLDVPASPMLYGHF